MFVIVMLTCMWMGLLMGISADTAAEATFDVEQEIADADIGEARESPEQMYEGLGPVAPLATELERFSIETPLDPYIRGGVYAFTEAMLRAAFTLANWSAFVGYHYLGWMPKIVVSGLAQLTMLGGFGYLLYGQYSRFQQMREVHQ